MEELVKYLKALTFLQVQVLMANGTFDKPELLLARAGLANKEIAEILGKSENAVAVSVHRSKKSKKKGGE